MTEFDPPQKYELNLQGANAKLALAQYSRLFEDSGVKQFTHLYGLLRTLRAIGGNELLKQKYGENYQRLIKKITEGEIIFSIIDAELRGLYSQTIYHDDVTSKRHREYITACAKVPLIHQELMDATMFLWNKSNLSNASVNHIMRTLAQKTLKAQNLITYKEEEKQKENDENEILDETMDEE